MGVFDGYHEEEYGGPQIEAGEYRLKIIKAEEKTFKSGNEGINIELESREGNRFFYNIIKNEYFNLNLTRFYDCFGIRRGNTTPAQWTNHYGLVYIDKGKPNYEGKTFMEIRRLIVKKDDKPDPPFNPLASEYKQLISDINSMLARTNPDMLPYFSKEEKTRANAFIGRNGPNEPGIKALKGEKENLASILRERIDSFTPIPGFEGEPAPEFENDIW
ncbi:MAG: DUF669 domain-containing protein [Treponema sp.]|jgi:hypothetical protein|nr:DUF669 domain-containing protein [Treponema sp.]